MTLPTVATTTLVASTTSQKLRTSAACLPAAAPAAAVACRSGALAGASHSRMAMVLQERDSVMLGEISPHHDYYDSKSSSETPPSYNQLNYNENLQRFFQSKPKTTVSDESNIGLLQQDVEGDGKAMQECGENNQKCLSPLQNSGASGSGSAGNLSSVSNPNMESANSVTNVSNDSYKPPHLTESLLSRHNEDMEKIMLKKHREQRSSIKENKQTHYKNENLHVEERPNFSKDEPTPTCTHGVKRCGSYYPDGDNRKISKHKYQSGVTNQKEEATKNKHLQNSNKQPVNTQKGQVPIDPICNNNLYQPEISDVNLWPPFSVTVTPMNPQPCINTTPGSTGFPAAGMFPIYYFPASAQRPLTGAFTDPALSSTRYQVPYIPGMYYNYNNTIYPPSPLICPTLPLMTMPMPMQIPSGGIQQSGGIPQHTSDSCQMVTGLPTSVNPTSTSNHHGTIEQKPNTPVNTFQRPASQATSVKVEPGSAVGSVVSASIANKTKDLHQPEPKSGRNYRNSTTNTYRNSTTNNTMDESSSCYSSSYSSFLKTDAGSGSNDDCNVMDNKDAHKKDNNTKKVTKVYPIRKKEPPWLESVQVSPDLIYRYQMTVKDLEDILKADLNTLKEITQPVLVNDQLNQLYLDMELEGLSKKLTLEEGITSSSSSGEENGTNSSKPKKKRKSYSSLVMIYEENAPLPSPSTDH